MYISIRKTKDKNMKKNLVSFLTSLFVLVLMLAFFGCNDKVQIKGIEITNEPTKVIYEEGEKFDPEGLVVSKVMSDESKEVITDYEIDKLDELKVSDKVVIVSYKDFSAKILITVNEKVLVKELVDVEIAVLEGSKYTRGMDVSDYVKYREVYSDESLSEWYDVNEWSIKDALIIEDNLKASISLLIHNQEWTEDISIPLNNEFITVSELLKKDPSEEEYLLNGILVSIATTMSRNEFILLDTTTNEFIGVSDIDLGGIIYEYNLHIADLKVGDELTIPVKLKQSAIIDHHSDSSKLYAEYVGGTALDTLIVSKDNQYEIPLLDAVSINNQEELNNFLNPLNRPDNFYSLVHLRGEMRYIYYAGSKHYRFFFDEEIDVYDDQKIDGASPTFNNGAQYYTTSSTVGDLIFDNAELFPNDWKNPATATKEIYALFIGGNTYYHEFVILEETHVMEIIPEHISTSITKPRHLAYSLGGQLNLTNAYVVKHFDYGDDLKIPITLEMLDEKTLPNMNVVGDYEVRGTYDDFDFSFNITVTDEVVTSIELIGEFNNSYHIRNSFVDIQQDISQLELKVNLDYGTDKIISITENMITMDEEWDFGEKIVFVSYLSEYVELKINILNLGLSVSEIKEKPESNETYDVYGVIVGSAFISGSTANPRNGEIFLKDKLTNDVIGLKGFNITNVSPYDGFAKGDEVLVTVTVGRTSSDSRHSEYEKLALHYVSSGEVVILSENNDTKFDLEDSVTIASQEDLNSFLEDSSTRANNAYKLVKFTAGTKFIGFHNYSNYITFTGNSLETLEIDSLRPIIHEMNEEFVVKDETYLTYLFGEGFRPGSFSNPNVLERDVYFMYVGGQGIYYHQFIIIK